MAEQNHRSLVSPDLARLVSRMIRAREKRAAVFSPNLFSDPAWDIMLTLFLAQLRQRRMAASDLSSATAVPLTTTHRWIDTLEQKGWLRRSPDPLDQRRVFVQLSERGSAAMGVWISDWIESRQKRVHDACPQDVPRRSGCQDAS